MKNFMRVTLVLLVNIFLCIYYGTEALAEEIAVNETSFPDVTFRSYILSHFDKDGDRYLSEAEIADIIEINCPQRTNEEDGVTSLKGIEYFTMLQVLYCSYNKIESLDFSSNPNLSTLYCDHNKLQTLDFCNNPKLAVLVCSNNVLDSLNIADNEKLATLLCENNQINTLSIRKSVNLSTFRCDNNNLLNLDVSNNTKLSTLTCSKNYITELDVSNCPILCDYILNTNPVIDDGIVKYVNNGLRFDEGINLTPPPTNIDPFANLNWKLENGTLTISGTGDMNNFSYDSTSAWQNQKDNIISVVIEDGITSIGTYAFYNCTNMTTISIPETVTKIGDNAFSWATNLETLTLPSSVKKIGNYAFYYCSGLKKIIILSDFTEFGSLVFDGCTNLTSAGPIGSEQSIEFAWKTEIPDWAFYNSSLTNAIIPDGITRIGEYAFWLCKNLESVTIPDSVTSIERSAFSGCSVLSDVSIPAGVTTIGQEAFRDCEKLTIVVIPQNITMINPGVFYGCKGLTSIIIPSKITSIEAWAFQNCNGLTSITIPVSVTQIGDSAFSGCYLLADIYFYGTQSQWNAITTGNDNTNLLSAKIHFIEIPEPDFTLPAALTTIGEEAFAGGAFTYVKLPDKAVSIGWHAFADCPNLTHIYIPEETTDIDDYAFGDMQGLTILGVPGSAAESFARTHGFTFVPSA